VNSILIGIVIDQHLIRGIDERVSTFFPEYADIFADSDKGKLRLKDLLTMSAGLSWTSGHIPIPTFVTIMWRWFAAPIPSATCLHGRWSRSPARKFCYSSGIAITLGQIVHKVSG